MTLKIFLFYSYWSFVLSLSYKCKCNFKSNLTSCFTSKQQNLWKSMNPKANHLAKKFFATFFMWFWNYLLCSRHFDSHVGPTLDCDFRQNLIHSTKSITIFGILFQLITKGGHMTQLTFQDLKNIPTVNSRFKKVHFSFLKSRVVWFKKDLCSESKNRSSEKNALCRWICNLRSFLNREFTENLYKIRPMLIIHQM